MARRFRGPFSPEPASLDGSRDAGPQALPRPAPGDLRHPHESRTRWITAAAVPFLLGAFFQGDAMGMATNLAGFGITAAAMWLTREGLQAEAAYDARRVARRPAIPRKLFGGILTGLGLAVGAAEPGAFAGAAVLGLTGSALHWLAFGPDPRRDKGMEGVDAFQQDRAARMVAEAETRLRAMSDAILRVGDRRLEARVAMFAATARALFDRVEQDPGDLTAARRYLGVYLQGARDASVKFADLYVQTRDEKARRDYELLLDDLERSFSALTQRLHAGGRTDMDIEIEVLRDRLAREGVRPALEDDRDPTADDLFRTILRDPTPR
ncbi:5-bromo-4-chloroindolyl phosphate hydrolysis family protein [Paracoccus endophyticus]|uniref:5-bromo-4-chloroindolyl phosphate hydrolysis family protein n=1 Tax=Paracoccus endophyticus TaxID=2233774 RepID=UPI000DD52AD9|nr:5-bromo-4-chloroindolyl phosphate hydrolysis family protein [Paracoccus endophyticus]